MDGSNLGFLLRPKWIAFHLLVLCSVALMISLGMWQLDRLDARKEFNSTVTERIDLPPVPLADLLDTVGSDPQAVEWREVTVGGIWLADQIVWFNRTQEGIAGDNILSALVDDDLTILVNRGFVTLGTEAPAPPAGDIEVLGRIRIPPGRQLGQLTDATDGPLTEVRRVDLDALDEQIPGALQPVYLDLIGSVPNVGASDPVPVPPPTLDEGPHLSYAVQWFIFSTAVALGWVLAVRRSIATHRRDAAKAARLTDTATATETATGESGEQTPTDSPTSAGVASTTTTP